MQKIGFLQEYDFNNVLCHNSPDVIIFLVYKMQNDQCSYCISTIFLFYMAHSLRCQTSPGSWHLLHMLQSFSWWILLSFKTKWIRKREGYNTFNNSVKSGGYTWWQWFKTEISNMVWEWHLYWHDKFITCLSILLSLLTSLISDSSVCYDGYTVSK